jgi:CRISPR type IV-associated protein Csf1
VNASALLAKAHGKAIAGKSPCFYCGNPADVPLVLSNSFNEWYACANPASETICAGCSISLNEKAVIEGRDKPQKTRNWSWLISDSAAEPIGQIARLRDVCLSPPPPPWALAIAVSGQKHLIWRTTVNLDNSIVVVQMELERVVYRPQELRDRLALAMRICAASGKPCLTEDADTGLCMRLMDAGLTEEEINDWFDRAAEPINQLAAHICPPKDECIRGEDH